MAEMYGLLVLPVKVETEECCRPVRRRPGKSARTVTEFPETAGKSESMVLLSSFLFI